MHHSGIEYLSSLGNFSQKNPLNRYLPDGVDWSGDVAYLSPFSKTAACWCNLRMTFHDMKQYKMAPTKQK
jgi:hypothetical protein